MKQLATLLIIGFVLAISLTTPSIAEDMGEITSGETTSGTIDSGGEEDSWTFSAGTGDKIIINVRDSSGGYYWSPYVRVLAPDLETTVASHVSDTIALEFEISEAGTYTILIRDDNAYDGGTYDITLVNLMGSHSSSGDPDGGIISSGETLLEAGTISASDLDVFEFSAQAGDKIILHVRDHSGGYYWSPYVRVLAPDLETIVASGTSDTLVLEFEIAETGTHTILIRDDNAYDGGTYDITLVNLMGSHSSSGDPDGGIISSGDVLSPAGTISASDLDVFQFSADAGDKVKLEVSDSSGGYYWTPHVRVLAPDLETLVASGVSDAVVLEFEVAEGGIYTILIRDDNINDSGTYNLKLSPFGDQQVDLVVSGLTVSADPLVQCGGEGTVGWTVKNVGEAVATPVGYWVAVRLSTDATYDETDTLIGRTQINEELAANATISGSYPLDPNAFEPGDYYLVAMVDDVNDVTESAEDNNTASTSVTISPASIDCMLTIFSTEGGSVDSPGEGDFTYPCGSCVSVEAAPDSGYEFDYWSGTAVEAGAVADTQAAQTTVCLESPDPTTCSGVDYTLVAHFVDGNDLEVETGFATDTTATTALLHGQIISDGGTSCEYRFQYWAEDDEVLDTGWEQGGFSGKLLQTYVAELRPATLYCFKAQVRASASGTVAEGQTQCFMTGVRLTISASQGGTVIDPGIGVFDYFQPLDVSVVAEATDPNSYFWSWTGSAVDGGKVADVTSLATSVVVDADDTLRAVFLAEPDELLDDLYHAPCRGADDSTSQYWDFADPNGPYDIAGPVPGGALPRLGTLLKCADLPPTATEQWWADDTYWEAERHGLFAASGLKASVNVPSSNTTQTVVYLQIVWHASNAADSGLFAPDTPDRPTFAGFEPAPVDWPVLIDEVTLPGGWNHSIYTWNVSPSPEMVVFTLRGRIVLDTMIVETCTEGHVCKVIHVDDDAASDPGPGDIHVSDPFEDGSPEHPFDSIQEGINAAANCDTVLVYDGRYVETIDLLGKQITVTGLWLEDSSVYEPSIIDANGLSPVVTCVGGKDSGCTLSGLTITGGEGSTDTAMLFDRAEPYLEHCLIAGNMALAEMGTVITCVDSEPNFVNCTISGNRAGSEGAVLAFYDCQANVANSIQWANEGPGLAVLSGAVPEILYSDVDFDWDDLTVLHADPLFAAPGYWDDLGTPDDLADDVWIEGDYHLQSTQGRFDIEAGAWVLDATDSPCIDAGDPSLPVGAEPVPNGARINMGTFGSTAQASKSP